MNTPNDHWLAIARHTPLAVLLDLDGTLVPFAATPDETHITPELRQLLTDLVAAPGITASIVSGRPRGWLEAKLGDVPGLLLVAEFAGWRRGAGAWEAATELDASVLDEVTAQLQRLAYAYNGAMIERKTWSVTLHLRGVKRAERRALSVEAWAAASAWIHHHPGFECSEGVETLDVQVGAIKKSLAVPWIRDKAGADARIIAIGDDLSDEAMFGALSPTDEPVVVAPRLPKRPTYARWRFIGPAETAKFLHWLLEARRGEITAHPPIPLPFQPRPRIGVRETAAPKLLVLSNRLPPLHDEAAAEDRKRNVGGLVSALEPIVAARHGVWFGWSGRTNADAGAVKGDVDDSQSPTLAWFDSHQRWYDGHYNGLCNGALWPLLHSFPERVKLAADDWTTYVEVNEFFASAATDLVADGASVWVHDYHLFLVARAMRRLGHKGPLGFFLHVPFPPDDVFSILPWSSDILDALLEFDLVAFHTPTYVENFCHCATARLGAVMADDALEYRGRRIRVRAMPIGITVDGFQNSASPDGEETSNLMQSIAPSRLVLGVDRLDYTKGIPDRLLAFGRMLELFPEWRGKVSLIQISVPSRADLPDYVDQRSRIENIVGRINGEYGEAHWVPIRYLYRSYDRPQLAQLYRAADVGYITPLRDGMNLIAKEYVAAQDPDKPGVLLLSQFAGAAHELKDAVLTNPWFVDGMARDLDRALRMDLDERRTRHTRLLAAVERMTGARWAEEFLSALESCR